MPKADLTTYNPMKLKAKDGKTTRYFQKLDHGCSLCLTVSPHGSKVWSVMLYGADGRGKLYKLGRYPAMPASWARDAALKAHKKPDEFHAVRQADSLKDVSEAWLAKAERRGVASVNVMRERLLRYVWPTLGARKITEIKRSDLYALRDAIADGDLAPVKVDGHKRRARVLRGGRRTADSVMTLLKLVFAHYTRSNDAYTTPFVISLKVEGGHPARERVLSDDEIRKLWAATETLDVYGLFVRFLLLSGMRHGKVRELRWRDYDEKTGLLIVPTTPKPKGAAGAKPTIGAFYVSPQLRAILDALPRDGERIFPASLDTRLARRKKSLDALMEPDGQWQLHDLRRTASSTMARIRIDPVMGERVLGHVIRLTSTQAIYDRHPYLTEKSEALHKLGDFVDDIVAGRVADNVVPLRRIA